MTYTEILTDLSRRLNVTSAAAQTRLGVAINTLYKRLTASLGIAAEVRRVASSVTTGATRFVTVTGVEKVISVKNSDGELLTEVSQAEMDALEDIGTDTPEQYAIYSVGAGSVTLQLDSIPSTAATLTILGYDRQDTLSGSTEPAFPESFHYVLIEGVLAQELRKQEKPALADMARQEYERGLSELRLALATSRHLTRTQGRTSSATSFAAGGSSSSGSSQASSAITFLQAGTGAVSRTVQSKLRDIVSTTDYDGATFGERLTQAITHLSSGGVVDARADTGSLTITGDVTISTSNIHVLFGTSTLTVSPGVQIAVSGDDVVIEGGGDATAFDASAGTSSTAVFLVSGDRVTLRNFKATGNRVAGGTSHLVHFSGGTGCRAEYLHLVNAGQCGIVTSGVTDFKALYNRVEGAFRTGIFASNSAENRDWWAIGNNVSGSPTDTTQGHAGIAVQGHASNTTGPFWIIGNKVSDFEMVGIRADGSMPTDVHIVDNEVDTAGTTGTLDGEGIAFTAKRVVVRGNRVNKARTQGILAFDACEDVIIAQNIVSNSSQSSAATHSAIVLDSDSGDMKRVQVIGNIGFDDQGTGTQAVVVAVQDTGSAGSMEDIVVAFNIGRGNLATPHVSVAAALKANVIEFGNGNDTSGNQLLVDGTMRVSARDDTDDAATEALVLRHVLTTGTVTTNFGISLPFYLMDATGVMQRAARIIGRWTDATDGSLDSEFLFSTFKGDSETTAARLTAGSFVPGTSGDALGSSSAQWRVFTQVIATASLPAAAASMDGALVIEDAGSGDRNLIVYAGGQRFRIDGGTNF